MQKVFAAICLCLGFFAGCSKSDPPVPVKHIDETRTLLIGLIPEQNLFRQLERYEPLANYLSMKIGRRIRIMVLPRYGNIIDNFVSASLDGAFFGSFTGALAIKKLGVEPLARPEQLGGISTYHGLIFVRKDSGIKTIREMKGKRFAFVDKATTAGYLLPLDYFRRNGVSDYRTYFRETYFTGTHEDAIYDVLNGNADIGAAKNTIFVKMARTDKRIDDELVVLAESPDVPENALCVRKDMDKTIRYALREALLRMHEDPAGKELIKNFGARRFIGTSIDDYKPVFSYADEIGLDLATYDYVNE